ncbi:unnamed protein product [Owenia fusiformis]|uniref:Uncharacterized protein n=1 Tax=Owenia fusiformis TaxID=6347 RepID=A0A8J1TSK9_OWEFU|nr:unnamed protein product [Owenia fusiformis]
MMKVIGVLAVCFIVVVVPPPCDGEYVESDYSNYYDEIAQATCTAMNSAGGWTFAVRRYCHSTDQRTCDIICRDPNLKKQDSQVAERNMACLNSLHVYQNRPRFAHGAGFEKLGLKIYRYNSCSRASCGPNYCCCRSW